MIGYRVMDIRTLRAAFDEQVRRNTTMLMPGVAEISAAGGVLRQLAASGQGRSGIVWSDLNEDNADEAIAAQLDFFRRRGEDFDWQLLGYDEPADLGERLVRAGFVPDEEEVLLFAETARVARDVTPPEGIRLVEVRDAAGVEAAASTQEDLLPGSARRARHVNGLLAALADERAPSALVLALAGDQPVCSARIAFGPGTEFAGLYSAATRTGWRGRGIYRAVVAYRARLAAERGLPHLRVETTAMSRPILRRLGFEPVTTTTSYVWIPDRSG
jgi:GNAT superfamily N-acetyltransferase